MFRPCYFERCLSIVYQAPYYHLFFNFSPSNINSQISGFKQIGVVSKFVSLQYSSIRFLQPIFYAHNFPCVFMKRAVKDPLWAILVAVIATRPGHRNSFLSCMLSFGFTESMSFSFPCITLQHRASAKAAPIILDGATCRLLKLFILSRFPQESLFLVIFLLVVLDTSFDVVAVFLFLCCLIHSCSSITARWHSLGAM